jgi:hypothetical protein
MAKFQSERRTLKQFRSDDILEYHAGFREYRGIISKSGALATASRIPDRETLFIYKASPFNRVNKDATNALSFVSAWKNELVLIAPQMYRNRSTPAWRLSDVQIMHMNLYLYNITWVLCSQSPSQVRRPSDLASTLKGAKTTLFATFSLSVIRVIASFSFLAALSSALS